MQFPYGDISEGKTSGGEISYSKLMVATRDVQTNSKLDTGRYTSECLTEREQVKHVSTLVITENKTTLLCQ